MSEYYMERTTSVSSPETKISKIEADDDEVYSAIEDDSESGKYNENI